MEKLFKKLLSWLVIIAVVLNTFLGTFNIKANAAIDTVSTSTSAYGKTFTINGDILSIINGRNGIQEI